MAAAGSVTVGVVMGSKSDWEHMSAAAEVMNELQIAHEVRVLSAHRTPDLTLEYAASARSRGLKVIIAGAGGAAHLAGVIAAKTILPVIGVPMPTTSLNGMDSLLSIVQMPKGVPVATMAIGKAGAANAGLYAAALIALNDAALADRLEKWRAARVRELLETKLP
ncbi:MAG TPA: 5-(carboxyamino)imidazole ribonucleotide mutase [Candidatus Binataceae bacterium]|jgi:5-(carboxyamino)imidazole ribonucleotide mutase|nr:5-(carboxyamino)imidazole ribonucleotide mutase [Candidatus Binataceae bacterium]